ncbi:ADP-ribosylation factor-like GTPase [Chloropicon primus]|uniref:ADP-ribosylation factor-like GTPase n=1 Tax=Chloropicon primus TaxID=1764295 RepID=A0A5B8MW92_9CHLO|nr:ADP-ribosylation factor-like GTPase [Chloropicon primus]UPR04297.1 ADP-ribosylation factor-like GTPase [Chloropicon primus]|eukprot:QDZ25088.1 ADP-ribosylation factor-like GTPase [Chloropicon primus]
MRLKKAKATLLVVGLDNSGKTTLAKTIQGFSGDAEQLQEGDILNVQPTIGFKVEKVDSPFSKGLKLNIVDMSGQQCYRELWQTYYEDVQGILFVVDAADHRRFSEAREALLGVVKHSELEKKPLLLFSNKMDLRHAGTGAQVAKEVGLNDLANHLQRAWRLQGCSAITGEGVDDGIKWLISQVKTC